MRRHPFFVLLSVLFILSPAVLFAAERSSHETVARKLVRVTGGVANAEAGAEAMMGMVRDNPELAPYEDVFRAWYKKVFSAGDFEGEMAQIYMKHFTERELNHLIEFYESPLGKKSLSVLPQIMEESAKLGETRAKTYQGELVEMLQAAKEKRERAASPNP